MHTSNIWRKLNLHWYKIAVCCFSLTFFFSGNDTFAQTKKNRATYSVYRGSYKKTNRTSNVGTRSITGAKRKARDLRFLNYGFFIGASRTKFIAELSESAGGTVDDTASTVARLVTPQSSIGFSLGFVMNFNIDKTWAVRLLPTYSIYERTINYTFADSSTVSQVVATNMVEIPLLVKYRSQLRGTKGMYMVAGVKPSFSVSAQQAEDAEILRVSNTNISVEYGFGFDVHFSFFRFSPELRFSHGIGNILIQDNNRLTNPIRTLLTHNVSLFLHFE